MKLHVTGATGYLGSELVRRVPDASTERVEVRDDRRFEGPIYEYACHEGNYGMANILRAQRLAEAQAKAAGGR